ncbi:MAG: hypothetical protein P1V81_11820 [Planctomycetota bacterium]|nr:hypothetical protein [Planctomycetota bacterium]
MTKSLLLFSLACLSASAQEATQPADLPIVGFLFDSEKDDAAPEADAPVRHEVVLHDIADLVDPAPPRALQDVLAPRDRRSQQSHRMAELLADRMPQGASVGECDSPAPGILRVEGDRAAQHFTKEFLLAQRSMTGPLIVDMTLIELPRGGLAGLGIEGASALFEDEAEYRAFLDRARAAEEVSVLSAPRLAVSAREHATMTSTTQVAYVADYELQIVEPGHQEILDPVIDVVEEGTLLAFDAVPMPGGVVEFDVQVDYSELERPIRTAKTRIRAGAGGEVEISLPQVSTVKLRSLVALRPGSAALFASAAPDAKNDFAVVMHFSRITSPSDPMVDELFTQMHRGTYAHRWFPPLEWGSLDALLQQAGSERVLEHFPTNPLSSQSMTSAPERAVALWLIEGLREQGNFPSLNPILVEVGKPMDPSAGTQARLAKSAAVAYREWRRATADLPRASAAKIDPLADTGLDWY